MPIYEYKCIYCGERFELLRRLTDRDDEINCPKCNKASAKRVLSTFTTASSGGICAPSVPTGST